MQCYTLTYFDVLSFTLASNPFETELRKMCRPVEAIIIPYNNVIIVGTMYQVVRKAYKHSDCIFKDTLSTYCLWNRHFAEMGIIFYEILC